MPPWPETLLTANKMSHSFHSPTSNDHISVLLEGRNGCVVGEQWIWWCVVVCRSWWLSRHAKTMQKRPPPTLVISSHVAPLSTPNICRASCSDICLPPLAAARTVSALTPARAPSVVVVCGGGGAHVVAAINSALSIKHSTNTTY